MNEKIFCGFAEGDPKKVGKKSCLWNFTVKLTFKKELAIATLLKLDNDYKSRFYDKNKLLI